MKSILISGGSGLVGTFLSEKLKNAGYNVHHLSRNPKVNAQFKTYKWNIAEQYIEEDAFENVAHIIHLAGASIAAKRWNKAYKKVLLDSRVDSAKLLITYIKNLPENQIKTFVSASAMGIYGDGGKTVLTETSPAANNFMAQLCVAWEAATEAVESLGIRRVVLRIPLVLAKGEGALEKMELPAKFGIGSYFGNGKQTYAWAHLADIAKMFEWAIENEKMQGVYNANSPQNISNKNFAKALNKALSRPFIPAPAPQFALTLALGEFAEALYWSSNLSNQKLLNTGFTFQFPEINKALADIYG